MRNLLIIAGLVGGLALAARRGKKGAETEAPPPAAPTEAPAPAAPAAPPLFPDGVPVTLSAVPDGLASISAQSCNACHAAPHDQWQGSDHAAAWTDPAFQLALERTGDSTICLACHLPLSNQHSRLSAGYLEGDLARPDLQPNTGWDPALMSEGVTCAACHVRDGQIVGTRPAPEAPHTVAVSQELATPELCATCHQLTWPGADQPFYNTFGEWKASAYADAGVRCQDCHMPPTPGTVSGNKAGIAPHHGMQADLYRALTIHLEMPAPELHRGSPYPVTVRVLNTGAGHHVPTGSPFEAVHIELRLVDAEGKDLAEQGSLVMGRTVEAAPPWNTLADTRVAAGAEVLLQHELLVDQRKKAGTATLIVQATPHVGDTPSGESVELRRLPLPVY